MLITRRSEGSPEQYQVWLDEKLKYSNEPGLRRRIKNLFDEFKVVLGHFKLDRKAFANGICNTRNYLTHYDQRLEGVAAKGLNLYMLVYGLQLLLDVGLLNECGIGQDVIIQLVRRRHMVLAKPGANPEEAVKKPTDL